jgi:hypothetical protein
MRLASMKRRRWYRLQTRLKNSQLRNGSKDIAERLGGLESRL